MTAVITHIVFDKRKFPISPYMQVADLEVRPNGTAVYHARGLKKLFNSYSYKFFCLNRPVYEGPHQDGKYSLHIGVEGPSNNPVYTFELENNERRGVYFMIKKMPLKEYLDVFEKSIEHLCQRNIHYVKTGLLVAEAKERLKINYLREIVFEGRLKGSSLFWDRFCAQLDFISVPLTTKMKWAEKTGRDVPITCKYAGPVASRC